MRINALAVGGDHIPAAILLPVGGGLDSGAELDVLLEIEAISDEVQPPFGLGLRRKTLARLPRFVQILGKPILVHLDLRIEACTRVTIPVPGSADAEPASKARTFSPSCRMRCNWYRPAMPAPITTASRVVFFVPFASLDVILAWSISLSCCFLVCTVPLDLIGRSCVFLAIQRNWWAGLRALKSLDRSRIAGGTSRKLVAPRRGGLERSRPFFGRNACAAQRTLQANQYIWPNVKSAVSCATDATSSERRAGERPPTMRRLRHEQVHCGRGASAIRTR